MPSTVGRGRRAGRERGTTAGLDTSCVATLKRPPFVTDEAGFAAALKSFGG